MKWNNYYRQYERHFPEVVTRAVEIGVYRGDGLRWLRNKYPHASLVGIDRDLSRCDDTIRNTRLFCANACRLNRRPDILRCVDGAQVILDDGGHRPYQQSMAFRALFPLMADGGVYAVEDLHLGRRFDWRLFSRFFGLRRMLHRMIDQQSKWDGPTALSRRSPVEIIFSPQLVLIRKGTIWMEVQ